MIPIYPTLAEATKRAADAYQRSRLTARMQKLLCGYLSRRATGQVWTIDKLAVACDWRLVGHDRFALSTPHTFRVKKIDGDF